MLKFIIFMFSTPVIFKVLDYLLRDLLAMRIMELLGAETGAMVYPYIILILTLIIDYFLFFRIPKGTETIIHDDLSASVKEVKKEAPAEVKEFKEDKFEEVSFLTRPRKLSLMKD